MIPIPALSILQWVQLGGTVLVVVFIVGSCMARDARIAREASEKTLVTIEKANVEVVKKASRSADRSRDPSVRGKLDPSTRD